MNGGNPSSYLVALDGSTAGAAGGTTGRTALGAVTRDVAGLVASVASLGVLGTLGAVTACRFGLVLFYFQPSEDEVNLTHVSLI